MQPHTVRVIGTARKTAPRFECWVPRQLVIARLTARARRGKSRNQENTSICRRTIEAHIPSRVMCNSMTRLGIEPRTYGLKVPFDSNAVRCNAARSLDRQCSTRCKVVRHGAPRDAESHCQSHCLNRAAVRAPFPLAFGWKSSSVTGSGNFLRFSGRWLAAMQPQGALGWHHSGASQ